MIIGEKIKKCIEQSEFSAEQVAAEAEMSVSNLQKIYKRDSIETRYLVRICRKLNIPYKELLEPEDWVKNEWAVPDYKGIANLLEDFRQSTANGKEKLMDLLGLRHKLELCQMEKSNLEQLLRAKEELIEVLRENKINNNG